MDSVHVSLVDAKIEIASLLGLLGDPDVGAHGWFFGVTRRLTHGRQTATLFYEAHRSMAKRELSNLAEAAVSEFRLTSIVIVHRLGEVPIGEASVALGCSSPHRIDTFDALPAIMDKLKRDVPIWKREHYSDGTTQWVHPNPVDDHVLRTDPQT